MLATAFGLGFAFSYILSIAVCLVLFRAMGMLVWAHLGFGQGLSFTLLARVVALYVGVGLMAGVAVVIQ